MISISVDGIFSTISGVERQFSPGEKIQHHVHGIGLILGGWEGHLQVRFPCGTVTFTNLNDFCLIPVDLKSPWWLMTANESLPYLERYKRLRQQTHSELKAKLEQDYLSVEKLFDERFSLCLTQQEFDRAKISFIQSWIGKTGLADGKENPRVPDDEQALAIGSLGSHIQVIARAGSGKTETVANRAAFLLGHCKVKPAELLLLAFNKNAASELLERVKSKVEGDLIPHIMTFHALAYSLVPGAKQLLINQEGDGEQSLNREFQHVLMDSLSDGAFELKVRRLMLEFFRSDLDDIRAGDSEISRNEMLAYRRSLVGETLRGDYVKSFGEKVIANFLFENDVRYLYEQNHWWKGRNYRPDFTLPKQGKMSKGVVIEYFGLIGDADYDAQIEEKRNYWKLKEDEWIFIELTPRNFAEGQVAFEGVLHAALVKADISLARLTEDDIWERIRSRSILGLTEAISGFVGRCRKMWLTPERLQERVLTHQPLFEIETQFIEIASALYSRYLDRLRAIRADDFDGLMQESIEYLQQGKSDFSSKGEGGDLGRIRFLFVDEYQDFTELFHQMVSAIRRLNPEIEVFCVGDDWQAISRYAGSDLTYYKNFKQIFKPSIRLNITTNRRSHRNVVNVSNALMANEGTPAKFGSEVDGLAVLVDLADFKPTSLEDTLFHRALLTPVVLRIAGKALNAGKSVVLLSVRNKFIDPGGRTISLDRYLSMLRAKLPPPLSERLSISTTHKYKGKESDVVIILDALARSYPLIHPYWLFTRVLGESIESIVDESRRLFYVALTRARESVFLITESGRESPFVRDIRSVNSMRNIHWDDYPPITESGWLTVKVSGTYESISKMIPSLKADNYMYRDTLSSGGGRSWERSFRVRGLDPRFLDDSPWIRFAKTSPGCNGVEVHIYDVVDQPLVRLRLSEGKLVRVDQNIDVSFDVASFINNVNVKG